MPEPARSRQARQLAETALVRIVAAYGEVPEFVLLGGLVPDLLCSQSSTVHVGTTDVDVQVNLEIAGGSVNATRLEAAHTPAITLPAVEVAALRNPAVREAIDKTRRKRPKLRSRGSFSQYAEG